MVVTCDSLCAGCVPDFCLSGPSSDITLEMKARFSRAHSWMPSAAGNSAAAARSIKSAST